MVTILVTRKNPVIKPFFYFCYHVTKFLFKRCGRYFKNRKKAVGLYRERWLLGNTLSPLDLERIENMELYDYQKDLIAQVKSSWIHGCRSPCIVLPCGGGKSVIAADMAKRCTDAKKQVLFLVHRKELCEQIYNTFARHGVDMQHCIIGTVQSLSRHLERLPAPCLIITDESHHAVSTSYTKIYDAFPDARRVSITATPERLDGKGLEAVNDALLFGPDVSWLIEQKKLSPYRCFAPEQLDVSKLKKRAGEYDLKKADELLKARKVYGNAVSTYQKLAKGLKAIAFCPTVDGTEGIAEAFRAKGIPAKSVNGCTPKRERAQIMQDFRAGEVQVLCSCDLISEGFDVPDCACSILLRPTASYTVYLQQAMRCMRYQPGKTAVIIDHVGNVLRHGLPDEPREYSLQGKKKETAGGEKTDVMRQCPNCFFAYLSKPQTPPTCPNCGFTPPKTQREEMEEEKNAKIIEITAKAKQDYFSYREMKSLWELQQFGKARGYKPGWAFYRAKEMNLEVPKQRRKQNGV